MVTVSNDYWINGVVSAAALLILAVVLTGCEPDLTDREAFLITQDIQEQVPNIGGLMRLTEGELGDLQIYVDRSASMQPYTAEPSTYSELLASLDTQLAGSIDFFAFGYPSQQQGQVVESISPFALEEPSTYNWVNNDYGPLFADFDPTQSHLAISDGVQSVADTGARQSGTVESVGAWVEQGGVFSLMVYRVPYHGTYYHEEPTTGAMQYSCDDRPVYLYGFFPTVAAKNALMEILEVEGLQPDHQFTIGETSVDVQVQERALGNPDDGRARGPRLLRNLVDHSSHPDLHNVASGRHTGGQDRWEMNVELDSTALPWASLPKSERRTVGANLTMEAQHWRVDSDSLAAKSNQVVNPPSDTPRLLDPEPMHISDDAYTVRMGVTVDPHMPEGGRERTASLLTFGVTHSGANQLIPDNLSVRRDDDPAACSQTLNIQPVMGAVIRNHYIAGQALLITQW